MGSKTNYLCIAVICCLLAGCVTPRGVELPELSDWQRRSAVLAGLEEWQFAARIAVKAGDEGFNGKLRWYQDAAAFRATVGGPLGIGTVRIEGDDDQVAITDKDGITTVLRDVEPDLYARYGWTIPVRSLRYWALGIPQPGLPSDVEFDADGELVRLVQRGWTVDISRYREAGGQPMPSRMTATHADTSVRLVIDNWVFHDAVGTTTGRR